MHVTLQHKRFTRTQLYWIFWASYLRG